MSTGGVASIDDRATSTATPDINFFGASVQVVPVQAIPAPSTYAMAAIGAGVVGLMGWRRRSVAAAAAAAV